MFHLHDFPVSPLVDVGEDLILQVREYGEIAYAVLDSEGNESSFDVYLDAQRRKHPLLPLVAMGLHQFLSVNPTME